MNQSIWKKILGSDEEIKYEFTIGYGFRKIGMIFGVAIGLPFLFVYFSGIPIILFFLFYFGWYLKKANKFAFTNKRILIHRGWLSTSLRSVDYDKITDTVVKEPFLERLICKTGYLYVNTAGTGIQGAVSAQKIKLEHVIILDHVENPYEIKKRLNELKIL